MANDFLNITGEVVGVVPAIPKLYVQNRLVNRAWSRIRDFRLWSFHVVTDAQLFCPAAITAGTISATFNSALVTANAAATTAFNAVAFGNPPFASPTLGVGYQLRVGSFGSTLSTPTGPNYNIVAWDGAGNLTIDKPYGEQTTTGAVYQALKCYYAPPASPFTSVNYDQSFGRYLSIINRLNGYSIRGKRLYYSQEQLNQMDPQRGGQGDAYIVANYGKNSLGQPVIELYPNPVNFTTYYATYISRWADLSPAQDLPQMPYELNDCVTNACLAGAGRWALANAGMNEALRQTNWVHYIQMQDEEFKQSLLQCIKQDDEIMPMKAFLPGSGFDFPLGGTFLQSHDLSSFVIPG